MDEDYCVFSLHESSAECTAAEPFLMPLASFEILKWMLQDVMNNLNLSDGSDQISGRLLLECSSLIARESKKGKEPESLQVHIKPHRVWLNTYFWEEYFWVQTTPKFEELNPETKDDEDAFFKVEIVEFAKGMFGWGNLGIYAIGLFVESLCDKVGLGDISSSLVKEVEAYCSVLQTSEKKQTKAITVAPSASHRRTVALSHAQIQEALNSQDGAAFDVASDEFKSSSRRTAPRNAKTAPGKTDRTKSTSEIPGKNGPSSYSGPIRTPKGQTPDGKPPPPKAAPSGPPKARPASESAEFQLSRRKMAAKTVQLTSTGFLANLNMSSSGFV